MMFSTPSMSSRALLLLSAVVLLMLSFSACGIAAFTINEESEVIEIQGQSGNLLGLGDLFPTRIPLTVNLEQELQAQDADGAQAVYLTDLTFALEDDSEEPNFDFIDEVTITIESTQSGSDLPSVELAWRNPAPEGATDFSLEIEEGVNLKPYIEEGMRLSSDASGSAPTETARFRVFAEFRVEVL
ncbi:hypothetical protein FRC98_06485 [Lujinxingia vulgaris]|uniref:Uncharacterized protein n=1 Tax=Lujinxingia vulgaris TaxID=2600176 RepID=A0A5C6XI28_9DELT|nr:hypothetical protein [Lujinxingia vulgaris]TXD38525.1 hypothetical protein FRC98_06485 [Lujinxingia vulgaris]